MDYSELSAIYDSLSKTSKRLEKTWIIAQFLKTLKLADIEQITLLLQGKLYPSYDEHKLGMSSQLVMKAISKAFQIPITKVELQWKKLGDLGDVAEKLAGKETKGTLGSFGFKDTDKLGVKSVFTTMKNLAEFEGNKSVEHKVNAIVTLLADAEPLEAKYLVRTVLEDLRVGLADGTLRDAIAWAYFAEDMDFNYEDGKTEVNDRELYNKIIGKIQHAYDLTNDFSVVCAVAKKDGIEGLEKIKMKLGVPVKVMLALKAISIEDGFERVGTPAQFEFKYDGFRVQLHKKGDKITLFTRRFENVTEQFPDIIKYGKEHIKSDACILDCEAVGYDKKTGKYLSFQNISQRIRRKYNIHELSKTMPVELTVFDILYEGKDDTLKLSLVERRKILERIIKEKEKKVVLSKILVTDNAKDVETFYNDAIDSGEEGLMIKKLDAPYKPGARVGFMLKLKPTMDPLELVITSAEWGEGKRKGWLSSFTLSCVDDGEYVEIGKMGTGIKEKGEEGVSFDELTKILKPLILSEKGKEVKLKPKIVVEVAYQEIQKSNSYSSGFALRFPALNYLRPDRRPEDASPLEYVQELFFQQKK